MQFNKDPEYLKKRAAMYKEKRDNPNALNGDFLFKQKLTFYIVRDGDNIIRLIPAMWADATFPWLEVYIHYQIGANNSQFFCLLKMNNQPCPICEEAKKATERGEKPEIIRTLYPQHRAIAWVIDRLEPSKGPVVWTMPYKNIAQQIITISFSRKTGEPVFVDDPETGWDILFQKEGKGMLTKYSGVRKDDEATPLHADPETTTKWLAEAESKSLKDQLQFKSYEHIKAVLYGIAEDNLSESPSEETSTVNTAPVTTTASVQVEPVTEAQVRELTKDMLKSMDMTQLAELVKQRNLDTDVAAWNSDELPEVIALELGLE